MSTHKEYELQVIFGGLEGEESFQELELLNINHMEHLISRSV